MNNRVTRYKSPGAKRLMLEARELQDNTEDYCAQPIDDNLFEWHFTLRGPPDTAFDGGYYHGRLSFPTEYPMKPPSIILLTPNGRFETNRKICLSISGYHPETWQPSWSVRTALLALIAFMPTKPNRAIGSLDFSDAERRQLALKSRTWRCDTCGLIKDLLVQPKNDICSKEEATSQTHQKKPSTSQISQNSNEVDEGHHSDTEDVSNGRSSSVSTSSSTGSTSTSTSSSLPEQDVEVSRGKLQSSSEMINSHCDQQKQLPQKHSKLTTPVSNGQSSSRSEHTHSDLQIPNEVKLGISQKHRLDIQSTNENRRLYSSIVLKSIFILLFLLILRRIVLMIQS